MMIALPVSAYSEIVSYSVTGNSSGNSWNGISDWFTVVNWNAFKNNVTKLSLTNMGLLAHCSNGGGTKSGSLYTNSARETKAGDWTATYSCTLDQNWSNVASITIYFSNLVGNYPAANQAVYFSSIADWHESFTMFMNNNGQEGNYPYASATLHDVSSFSTNPNGAYFVNYNQAHVVSGDYTISGGTSVNIPVANFACVPTSQNTTENVVCTDTSTNTPTNWYWVIDAETLGIDAWKTSTSKDFTWDSSYPGLYSVNLYANNSAGGDWENKTNYVQISATHLDLDVRDSITNGLIQGSTIGIYDPLYNEWRNSTCLYGACGFMDSGTTHQYPLVTGHNYTLFAQKSGYLSDQQTIVFDHDFQLVTLLLTNLVTPTPTIWPIISPTPTYDPNSYHLDVDIKNDWTNSYIMGSTIGIYDPVHNEWRNSTCLYGACGFQDSGATHQYPLVIGQDYTIFASYYGFTTVYKIIKFKEDHQFVELRLVPTYQQALHLDLDVKDAKTNGYLESTSIGIYDPLYNEWRNSTCITGACGFIDSGATHQYPLVIGHIYKLVAATSYYTPIAQDVVFAYDHQLITLYLQPENVSSYLSLWLDVKDGSNNGWIQNSEIGIYDPVHDDWRNSTCLYGACGFKDSGAYHQYPLVLGNNYTLVASKTGYFPANDTITFNYDNQMVTLILRPSVLNASVAHLDLDVKDSRNKSYIAGSTIGIYDPIHNEWRNSTCLYGACGFIDSGSAHQYPLIYYNTYVVTAAKAGYRSATQTLVVSYDHQLFTLYLTPNDKAFVTPIPTGRDAEVAPALAAWGSMLPGISGLLLIGCVLWVVGGSKK